MEARTATLLGVALLVGAGFALVAAGDDEATPQQTSEGDDRNGEDGTAGNDFLLDGPRPASTTEISDGSEPVILADAFHQDRVWIADTSGIHRSTDNGDTWEALSSPFLAWVDGIDLAQDDAGTLYATTTNGATITFSLSTDGGDTWQGTPATLLPRSQVLDGGGVADRPWMAAHGDGQLGLTWNPGTNPPGTRCVASADGGQSWADRGVSKSTIIAGENSFDEEGNLYWAIRGELYRLEPVDVSVGDARTLCAAPVDQVTAFDAGVQAMSQTDTAGSTVYTAAPSADEAAIEVAFTASWPGLDRFTLDPTLEEDGEEKQLATNTFVTLSATQDELAIGWYGSEDGGDFTSSAFDGVWNVYVAQVENPESHDGETLTCSDADVTCTRATTAPNHEGPICPDGVACDVDRDLLDYFMVDHGPDGVLHVAYADDYDDGSDSSDVETHYAKVLP